jgi:hypothetical protein
MTLSIFRQRQSTFNTDAASETRLDDLTVGAFLRNLEDIEADVREIDYPDYEFAAGKIVPIEVQNKPWVKTVTYRQVDQVGFFKMVRGYSTDIPMVNQTSEEITQPVFTFASGYEYSDDEIAASVHMGEDLETEKITTVNEAAEQTMNSLIATGDLPDGSSSGFSGFVNHPDAIHSYSPIGINSGATANQILSLLNDTVISIPKMTLQVEKPDTLVVTLDAYHYLTTARIDSTRPETLMTQFLSSTPYIKDILALNELSGAGPNGTDLMVAYRTRIKARVKQPLTFKDLLRQALGYKRVAVFKFGGVVLYRPLSMHVVALPS